METHQFIVQEHRARRLHWDFRLELDCVLKSWAVPRGVPTELKVKRLAVEVEDHPLSYFDFEGEIPKGQYGAGSVKVWDKGRYVLLLREPGKYHILLKGRKLEGDYRLVRFKDKNWLIFRSPSKEMDASTTGTHSEAVLKCRKPKNVVGSITALGAVDKH